MLGLKLLNNQSLAANSNFTYTVVAIKMANKIINNHELLTQFELFRRVLPTKHDCLLYVISQTNQYAEKMSRKSVVHRLVKVVEEIWNKVGCCTVVYIQIGLLLNAKLFESEIWGKYKFLQHEHYLPGESLP